VPSFFDRVAPSLAAAALLSAPASAALAQSTDDGPVWVRQPSRTEIDRNYPIRSAAGVGGAAAIRCKVTAQGTLTNCAVAAEAPAGMGFGQAALNMHRSWRMKPLTSGGKPVAGATVVASVRLELAGGSPAPELNMRAGDAAILVTAVKGAPGAGVVIPCPTDAEPSRRCLGHAFTWRNRASPGAVARALAASSQTSGISLLECSSGTDGRLSACRVGGEADEASKTALLELSKLFRAPAFAQDSTPMRSGRVLMEIDWGLVRSWQPAQTS
jgi:TonB family protein